jgi:hypothetical protein
MIRLSQNRRWVVWSLLALLAVQMYFVRELLAVVLLAAVVCCVFGAFIGAYVLLHRLGARVLGWVEVRYQPAAERAVLPE